MDPAPRRRRAPGSGVGRAPSRGRRPRAVLLRLLRALFVLAVLSALAVHLCDLLL
ncbi:hypothetical protein [Streptomyces roseoverticillatus]|uniref:hypothetical protein n=1 Tax=Streptomyces roseoverticillatus TaxID=66429 RepID=UPI0014700A02|nr:hypothetical protein [Streptomyces roseoverticillatus]